MSTSDISASTISPPRRVPRWHSGYLARKAFFSALKRIESGSLLVQEGGHSYCFGDSAAAGAPHAVVEVHDPAVYRRLLTGGSIGAGEAYMLGHWSSPDLVAVIRLFCANMPVLQSVDAEVSALRAIAMRLGHWFRRNSLRGSRRNIAAHYDLGNDFFRLFLDPTMMYSAAVFPDPAAGLEAGSLHKLALICEQLQLQPDDHLLEIGSGWGGMAVYAAWHYGCRVTTTTLSREQYEYTCERVREAGLADRVEVLCRDYRELEGQYDKLVSIEMIEAVGHRFYRDYFSRCSALLRPEGLMVIQAITMQDQRYRQARDSVDFIQRYIFPGGCLPSLEVISAHLARDTDMQMVHLRDITADYAATLAAWRERFQAALPEVRAQGFDELFERMWDFYLCYCEGGFRERVISTVQLTFAKPAYRFAQEG